MKTTITFSDFQKLELKVGTILEAEKIESSDKLLKLKVDTGEERQIIAGIGKSYETKDLIGIQIVVVTNLEPKTLFGVESQGMLLAAHDDNGEPVLLAPSRKVGAGSKVG